MGILHQIILLTNQFRKYPNARRSAEIVDKAIIHRSVVVGERVKIKGDHGRFPWIEENVFINDDVIIWCDVWISRGTRINPKAALFDSSYYPTDFEQETKFKHSSKLMGILIGENVLIDTGAIICKGVAIGDNSVIAAGAVVTSDVPPNCYAYGNPATYIRKRVPEEKCEKYASRR